MDKRTFRIGWWALAGLLFGGAAVTGVLATKEIERRLFPVVTDFKVARSVVEGRSLLIWGTFEKVRDCKFVEATAQVGAIRLDLEFQDSRADQSQNRAVGPQAFGPWKITPGIYPIKLVSRNACHSFWDNTTTMLEGYRP